MALRRMVLFAAVALVAVAAIGAGGWWFFIREDSKLATVSPVIPKNLVTPGAGSTPGAASTAAASIPAVGSTAASGSTVAVGPGDALTFRILPAQSEAAYFADEKLASLPLPSKAKGTTKDVEGEFHLTADGFGLDTTKVSKFTVNLTTIKSDRDMRDSRVQNQGLETAKFPTATFTASKVTGYDKSIAAGDEQTLQLTGTLDLHGVQKEITWDVKARRQDNVITGLATVAFKFADFGIPVLNIGGFVSVQDTVTLQVTIVAQS